MYRSTPGIEAVGRQAFLPLTIEMGCWLPRVNYRWSDIEHYGGNMDRLANRIALVAGIVGGLSLGGGATGESVERAQASADAAGAAAMHAQGSADAAGAAANAA